MSDSNPRKKPVAENQLSSGDLAAIIVDAMIDAGIVYKKDVFRALEIATDKIDGRKELGDY